MCEYAEGCEKADDPLWRPLWERRKDAECVVVCNSDKHVLAALFPSATVAAVADVMGSGRALPDGGLVVVTPPYVFREESLFVNPQDPAGDVHFHAAVIPAADYEPGEWDYGRCRCGSWVWHPKAKDGRLMGSAELPPWEPSGDMRHVKRPYYPAGRMFTANHPTAIRVRES